jgi:hypothetical protein
MEVCEYATRKLLAAGHAVSGVAQLTNGSLRLDFPDDATPAARLAAASFALAMDLSGEAILAEAAAERAERAKADLASPSPLAAATRATARVLYQSLAETRAKLNEAISALGLPVAPLAIRTWDQAVAAVGQAIDAERAAPSGR